MTQEREYVLGTHRAELDRLGLQHAVWRAQAHEAWERAGFAPGWRVLDVGCGPGFATLDLARIVGPAGRVTAVDLSRRFLDHLEEAARREGLAQVVAREGDVQALTLDPGSADGAWTRWVLSFVPEPERVVAGVARALRPGGTWAIHEYVSYEGMRLSPGGEHLARLAAAIRESWRLRGGEPDVTLRLPPLLEKHGLAIRDVRPIARVARPGSLLWQWPESFFVPVASTLAEQGLLTEGERDGFVQAWQRASRDPNAFCLGPIVLEIVATRVR